MINKKNLLGKTPAELGIKDAIHVAIVAVRAGKPIEPGQRCGMNKDREAVPDDKGCGVADPFLKGVITRGQSFWLLLNQDEVPNVAHVWEHPSVDFAPPSAEVVKNKWLQKYADDYGVTYEQLMAAANHVVFNEESAPYPGTKTAEELDKLNDEVDSADIWYEWKNETLHEFYNNGTECCPDYAYPDYPLFKA